jgi:hypothetical protein
MVEGRTLELTADQVVLLADLLDGAIRELSPEIADTDNPAYRRELKEHREQLRAVRALLEPDGGQ